MGNEEQQQATEAKVNSERGEAVGNITLIVFDIINVRATGTQTKPPASPLPTPGAGVAYA